MVGSSESILVKMPHCWRKPHVIAQLSFLLPGNHLTENKGVWELKSMDKRSYLNCAHQESVSFYT